MTGKEALSILVRAGTSKDYTGLWRDVEAYTPPPADAELPELVEVAEVGSFTAAMAQVDRAFDNLKLCRDAKWTVPPDHPDLVPAQEALLLQEGLHEAGRNLRRRLRRTVQDVAGSRRSAGDRASRCASGSRRDSGYDDCCAS